MTIDLPEAVAANRVISTAAVADLLGVSEDTFKRMCARGEGPQRIKLSPRRIGVRVRDLDAWLEQRARKAEAT